MDGYLARSRNMVTDLGKLLDPIADKLLLFATIIPIYWISRARHDLYDIPVWGSVPLWVCVLLIGRELAMTGFRWWAQRRGMVIAAAGPGKLKATIQNIYIGATFLWFTFRDARKPLGWEHNRFAEYWNQFHGGVVAVTLALATALTVYSFIVVTKQVIAELFGMLEFQEAIWEGLCSALRASDGFPQRRIAVRQRYRAALPCCPTAGGPRPDSGSKARSGWLSCFPASPPKCAPCSAMRSCPGCRSGRVKGSPLPPAPHLRGARIPTLAERLGEVEAELAPLSLAYLPGTTGVDLRLTAWNLTAAEADARLEAGIQLLRLRAGESVYGEDETDLGGGGTRPRPRTGPRSGHRGVLHRR